MPAQRPVGVITRGTTNPNRLRRCDAGSQAWRLRRHPTPPVVVDLGYGASPVTAVELHDRLLRVRGDVEVVGVEIDPERVVARLAPDGLLVDGTWDELGRLAAWVAVTADGPQSLTLAWRLRGLECPGVVAERLPKTLIHRNVPGEPVHALLTALDAAWERQASLASYGVRQRFIGTVSALRDAGWPVLGGPSRWRLGELGVAWEAVAPHQGP